MRNEEDLSTFGKRLLAARKAKRLSQTQLAKAVGISQSMVSELEHDEYVGTSYIVQLARATGVNPAWLQERRGPRYPSSVVERPASADRQNGQAATDEDVTKVTSLPEPFDHDRFADLPQEQQRDIAQVAALMVDAFSRFNTPPEERARPWGKGSRSVEAEELQPTKRPPRKSAG